MAKDAWVIVDDYHFAVDSPPLDEFRDWLLTLTSLRPVVATRHRPGWAFAHRPLNGELATIGKTELAFTATETTQVVDAVSDRLLVSPSTIKVHIHHILEKLRAHARLQAVLKYRERTGTFAG
jgi:ATP/maltotriose-dependent transcriptional regulator MalT